MSDAETSPSDAAAPPPSEAVVPKPEHEEYLSSGARFRRWNLVTLILGLLCLGVGLWVVHSQRQAEKQGGQQSEKE